jgi:hypothetical protein
VLLARRRLVALKMLKTVTLVFREDVFQAEDWKKRIGCIEEGKKLGIVELIY